MTLTFDGQVIVQPTENGPYQVSALSILRHDGAQVDVLHCAEVEYRIRQGQTVLSQSL